MNRVCRSLYASRSLHGHQPTSERRLRGLCRSTTSDPSPPAATATANILHPLNISATEPAVSFRQACLNDLPGNGTVVGFTFGENNHGWTRAWRHSGVSAAWG